MLPLERWGLCTHCLRKQYYRPCVQELAGFTADLVAQASQLLDRLGVQVRWLRCGSPCCAVVCRAALWLLCCASRGGGQRRRAPHGTPGGCCTSRLVDPAMPTCPPCLASPAPPCCFRRPQRRWASTACHPMPSCCRCCGMLRPRIASVAHELAHESGHAQRRDAATAAAGRWRWRRHC